MFAPPERLPTRVFAELPKTFQRPSDTSEWKRDQPGGVHLHSLLEGPCITQSGRFLCVDVPFGRVFDIDKSGEFTLVSEYDGEPNGLRQHPDGRLFIADYKNGIMLLDEDTGAVTPVLERWHLERLKAVNDLVFASNGDLYFTDQGLTGMHDPSGRVFRLRHTGELDCLVDNVPSPNGLVLNHAETELYVAATRGNAIWRVPLLNDGSVAKVGIFIQMSGGQGPDGLWIDADGNIIVAHVGLGAVWVFSPQGEPLYRVDSCRGPMTTNVVYAGNDYRTLLITESLTGTILAADMPVAGHRPAGLAGS